MDCNLGEDVEKDLNDSTRSARLKHSVNSVCAVVKTPFRQFQLTTIG